MLKLNHKRIIFMSEFYNESVKDVLEKFHVNPDKGLSAEEVKKRQKKYGKNILNIKKVPLWRKLIEPFCDLFMVILIIALILAIIQGSTSEIIIIAIDIICDAGIFYFQQFSTERVLRNLKKKTVHPVKVLRGGKEVEVDSSDLVPGDIVFLVEGEKIPADGRVILETGVLTNESMLTGESDSVIKDARAIAGQKKVFEQKNMVFSGSFVITGTGKMVVVKTGNDTEYGHIASLASGTEDISPIQEKINKLVVKIAIAVLVSAVIVFIIQLINGFSFFQSAEFTLAIVVSAVPEDLPIATAVILAIGASKMAKKKALVKELRAIESIGVVTTVASDKTGTLTENRLSLQKMWFKKSTTHPEDFIAKTALPISESGDPMDNCLWKFLSSKKIEADCEPAHSYAFDQDIRMSGNLFEDKNGKLKIYLKGAPETIIRRSKLSQKELEEVEMRLSQFTDFGYKVLALATITPKHAINELSRLEKDEKLEFVGFLAVSDTIRKEAKNSILEAENIGVKIKMVTGDHAGTAFAIGKQLGLAKKPDEVLDCSKLGQIDDETLAEKVKQSTVFARVTPEDKFRILEIIKKSEVVAMTGDGVNDVPALTNAHIGIAMGDGPSIVGDAGDIVLVDNNFKNIVDAIKEGRIILTNIRRMLVYLLATNAGEVLTMIFALIFGQGQLLLPIQILWVNLVTDSLMVLPIGLEPAERRVLAEKPERKDAPILQRVLVERIVIIAISMATITLSVYYLASLFFTHEQSNTLAFISLVVMQWSNAFTTRGIFESCLKRLKVKNILFVLALVLAIFLQVLATFGPLRDFVSVVSVPIVAIIFTVVVAFLFPIYTVELHKILYQRKKRKKQSAK